METAFKIKQIREKHKLTQEEFAHIIGRSRSLIAAWERGIKEPGREALKKISAQFNVSIEYIIDKEKNTISTLAKGIEEVTLIELFRDADETTQQSILHLLSNKKK
ncbi:hypothetical protein COMNV_01637 [Commensalibacter sp. Nvir]|uniref:helix-turn-helix transcriptional regulator n=1 Tax=Commensalibacter sp. Nvir TaxID=3069817 RepID=UPI002D59CA5A|nr:hypothetical protein COMNV_01637 [Commensalibacter sp. Nvir]